MNNNEYKKYVSKFHMEREKQMIDFYERYLNDDDLDMEFDNRVKLNTNLGLISTVEEARKKLEEIYFPNDSIPVLLSKKSAHLKLIQNIRNEAHRFAITYHKQLRSKTFLRSKLEEIKGIGEKTRLKLINEFGSLENTIKQDLEKLSKVVGKNRANDIRDFFRDESN